MEIYVKISFISIFYLKKDFGIEITCNYMDHAGGPLNGRSGRGIGVSRRPGPVGAGLACSL